MFFAVLLNIGIHTLRRATKGKLSKRQQIAAPEKMGRGALRLRAEVNLPITKPREKLLWRHIDVIGTPTISSADLPS